MGRSFRIYLAGDTVFSCKQCGNHLAVGDSIMSKNFRGTHGKAYLMSNVVNCYTAAESEDRDMLSGKHTVRDLFCRVCRTTLGWKYDVSFEPTEKYKENKFILERELITERPESKRDIENPRIEIRELARI